MLFPEVGWLPGFEATVGSPLEVCGISPEIVVNEDEDDVSMVV
jgi:hypothetical protein